MPTNYPIRVVWRVEPEGVLLETPLMIGHLVHWEMRIQPPQPPGDDQPCIAAICREAKVAGKVFKCVRALNRVDLQGQLLGMSTPLPIGTYCIILYELTPDEFAQVITDEDIDDFLIANVQHRIYECDAQSLYVPINEVISPLFTKRTSSLFGAGIGFFSSSAIVNAPHVPLLIAGISANLLIVACTVSVAALALLLYTAYQSCAPSQAQPAHGLRR